MARVRNIPRAKDLLPIYEELAPDLCPVRLDSRMSEQAQHSALQALAEPGQPGHCLRRHAR